MDYRMVYITDDANFENPDTLAGQPFLVKCWRLPWQWTLLEISLDLGRPYGHPTVALKEQCKPQFREIFNVGSAMIHEDKISYDFPAAAMTTRLLWPMVGRSKGWSAARTIRVAGMVRAPGSKSAEAVRAMLGQWFDFMAGVEEVRCLSELQFADDYFHATYEFGGPCGDATMALLSLVLKTRRQTSIRAIGFFLPDDYTAPFESVMGHGEIPQRVPKQGQEPGKD